MAMLRVLGAGLRAFIISSMLLLGVVITGGTVTWFSDSCTVQMGNQNANLTLQGWGSKTACQEMENNAANTVMKVLDVFSLGRVDFATHEAAPSGTEVCSGWDGDIH
ncbi:MAG TPA: hypothetical protein VF221_13640, partial [Chloroflexota bacterium]